MKVFIISQRLGSDFKPPKDKNQTMLPFMKPGVKCNNIYAVFITDESNNLLHSEVGINHNVCPSTSQYLAYKKAILLMNDRSVKEFELFGYKDSLNTLLSNNNRCQIPENKELVREIGDLIKESEVTIIKKELVSLA